jgi:hypothetical protein
MKAELVPENGDPPIPIVRDVTIVGRREYCDVVINHHSLSKRHCVLVKTDGLLVIRDLATTNGTKVKGQKVRWAALLPDDRISLGAYKLRVYLGPDDMPSPSEQYAARGRVSDPAPRGVPTRAVSAGEATTGPIATWPGPGSATPLHRPMAPSFPEPSRSGMTVIPQVEAARPQKDRQPPAALPSPDDEFHFEILDDDDEIIDLD